MSRYSKNEESNLKIGFGSWSNKNCHPQIVDKSDIPMVNNLRKDKNMSHNKLTAANNANASLFNYVLFLI